MSCVLFYNILDMLTLFNLFELSSKVSDMLFLISVGPDSPWLKKFRIMVFLSWILFKKFKHYVNLKKERSSLRRELNLLAELDAKFHKPDCIVHIQAKTCHQIKVFPFFFSNSFESVVYVYIYREGKLNCD